MLVEKSRFLFHEHQPWHTVGQSPIILDLYYDSAQCWFSFCEGIIFKGYAFDDKKEKERYIDYDDDFYGDYTSADLKRFAQGPLDWKGVTRHLTTFIPPKEDVPQLEIPFTEYRSITGNDMEAHRRVRFPTFERDAEGALFRIDMEMTTPQRRDANFWCLTNLEGRFAVTRRSIYIERANDYIIARLKY